MTSSFRGIPIDVHGAIEVAAAPLLLVAPFALGFGLVAGSLSIALGALVIGLALSVYGHQGERGHLSLSAHAGFDRVLAAVTIGIGLAVGIFGGDIPAAIFMVGFGSAHLALTVSTRYSRPLGT
jgi:hypothetical protein